MEAERCLCLFSQINPNKDNAFFGLDLVVRRLRGYGWPRHLLNLAKVNKFTLIIFLSHARDLEICLL